MSLLSSVYEADKLTKFEREELQVIENLSKKVCKTWMILYPWINDPNFLPDNKRLALK